MANDEHLNILKQGVNAWNQWRQENPNVIPDLSRANLYGARLSDINFFLANLSEADLRGADLFGARLYAANLERAKLWGAHLVGANLSIARLGGAELRSAKLESANLCGADLSGADLRKADLTGAYFGRQYAGGIEYRYVVTSLENADLTDCKVYGVSAWDVRLEGAKQSNLVITPPGQPIITVDNLEVAQFIYLLLHNERIRRVIDTITTKVVLILGRFTPERKAVLDAIRQVVRKHDLVPLLFDFDKPASKDTHETVTTLARLARFVLADITDPKSIPQELVSIVESLPSLPVQPLLLLGNEPWGMYDHIKRYPWVLPLHQYKDTEGLLAALEGEIIPSAQAKAKELQSG